MAAQRDRSSLGPPCNHAMIIIGKHNMYSITNEVVGIGSKVNIGMMRMQPRTLAI